MRLRAALAAALAAAVPATAAADAASTERVSVGHQGQQGDHGSGEHYDEALSRDGRTLAFMSDAANLVPGDDEDGHGDLFVRDLRSGAIELVLQPDGRAAGWPELSHDGRVLAFGGTVASCGRVYLRDRVTGATELVPFASGPETHTSLLGYSLSPDGRYVASLETPIRSGRTCAEQVEIDREDDDSFDPGPALLVVYDRVTRKTTTVDTGSLLRFGGDVVVSRGARRIALTPWTSESKHVYAIDRATGRRRQANLTSGERRARSGVVYGQMATISADGRSIAFVSTEHLVRGDTGNDPDVFVRDLRRGRTTRVSVGTRGAGLGDSTEPAISADGRMVAFMSTPQGLTTKQDVYVRDRATRRTRLVSVTRSGNRSGRSFNPAISGNGRFVSFTSRGGNFVTGDTNGDFDVFLRGPFPR